MRSGRTWLRVLAGLVGLVVAGSVIAQAVRQGSWTPILSMSGILGALVAIWPLSGRRCRRWPRSGREAG
jgi:hypothetical protein